MGEPSGMAGVPARGVEPMDPYLSRWGAQAQQRRWPLLERVVTVGRASCADVVIDATRSSRGCIPHAGGGGRCVDDR